MEYKKHLIVSLLAAAACQNIWAQQKTSVTFDDETERWYVLQGKAELTDRDAHKGKALRLSPGTKINVPVKLTPNTRYRVSAWMKTASGETSVSLQTIDFGSDISAGSARPDWTLVSEDTYMALPPAGKHKPYLEVAFNGNSEAWVDDICVEPTGRYVAVKEKGIKPKPQRTLQTDFGVTQQPDEKMKWMHDSKIGMFIHWGLYSGIGQGEWYQQNKGISIEEYSRTAYPESGDVWFDAKDYDADEWMKVARSMGARYTVLTAMHHDGFALFDSRYMNAFTSKQTLNRDLVREYVDAARKAGMRVGLYKTLINWRFPGYYDTTGTDCKPNTFGYKTEAWHKENARQMKEELYCQMKELMTNYGQIDMLFWDGGWIAQKQSDRQAAPFWESYQYLDSDSQWPVNPLFQVKEKGTGRPLGLIGMIRQLQPDILMNPRSGWIGDYACDEGDADIRGTIRITPQEKNITLGKTWGYTEAMEHRDSLTSLSRLQRYLADCMMRNINLLINVTPDRHGRIPQAQQSLLGDFGKWVTTISDAVYGTTGGPWQPRDGEYGFCYKDNRIFVYLLDGHKGGNLTLPDVEKGMTVKSVYNVASGTSVSFKQRGTRISIATPSVNKDDIKVICLEFKSRIMR